ncbi:hypothetical protein TNCV_4841951 [Trichonephila clavipes]|nr:hypothetical protein TNCV_4841951 [Trichonephila clavipes]
MYNARPRRIDIVNDYLECEELKVWIDLPQFHAKSLDALGRAVSPRSHKIANYSTRGMEIIRLWNGIVYPEIPGHLSTLYLVSDRLISPRIPITQIRRLRHVLDQFGILGGDVSLSGFMNQKKVYGKRNDVAGNNDPEFTVEITPNHMTASLSLVKTVHCSLSSLKMYLKYLRLSLGDDSKLRRNREL